MEKLIAQNKKALFDYEILKSFEAGVVLAGYEVKSVKQGNINLKGSYVSIREGELYLKSAHISKYKQAGNITGYDPERERKLLLKKPEIRYIAGKMQEKGLTIVPIKVYIKGGKVKIEIGVGRGKKKYEKKEIKKKRDIERDIKREQENLRG